MKSPRAALVIAFLAVAGSPLACGYDSPRMFVARTRVHVGDSVVVRFQAPPVAPRGRGDVWLTLVPAGLGDAFSGERVVIDEGSAEATIPAVEPGTYELRLVDESPRRLSRVVSRVRVEVARAEVARNEAPAWYW
jgi:hypothetical protein